MQILKDSNPGFYIPLYIYAS